MKTERARLKINVLPLQRIVIGVNWAKGAFTDNNTFPKAWLPYLIIEQDVKIWSSRSYARHSGLLKARYGFNNPGDPYTFSTILTSANLLSNSNNNLRYWGSS